MKMMKLLALFLFNILILNASVCPLFAKVPTTPKILFISLRDGNSEVYIMNPDGSEQVNLTQHPAADLQAVWSLTGDQILFISNRRDFRPRGNRDLYLMDSDGTNVRRVFKRKINGWRTDPTWSPDGKQIAYWQRYWNGEGRSGMYLATLGKQDEEFIGKYSSPAWSPDGTEIACQAADPAGTWIIFINIHTRKQQRFLPKKALPWQTEPSWSATAHKLTFAGNNQPIPAAILDRDLHKAWRDKQTIFIANRDGTGLQQLLEEAGPYAKHPVLSPNGEKVLYTQKINGESQIFKLDVNSGIQTQLTHIGWNFGGDWFDPAYALSVSPQSQLLTTTWAEVKKK